MSCLVHLEKMTLVWGKHCFQQRNWVFEALTGPSSYRSENKDYEDPLVSNKLYARPFKVPNIGLY